VTLWAIVPVKPLVRSKSRLSDVLSNKQREALSSYLLNRTVQTLKDVSAVSNVLVVSRDPAALAIARGEGAKTLQETGLPELNASLTRATSVVTAWRATSILILPIDIPFSTSQDIQELVEIGKRYSSVISITPDRRGAGTNALLIKPPGSIPYCYGENSFQKHLAEAKKANLRTIIHESTNLSFDIDTPEDLDHLKTLQRGLRTKIPV